MGVKTEYNDVLALRSASEFEKPDKTQGIYILFTMYV